MCDLPAVRAALDGWLIPDVVRIECKREVRLHGDPDYDEAADNSVPYHFTKITLRLPPCVCGLRTGCECPIWNDLGWYGVDGQWALSHLGFPETEEALIEYTDDGLTEIAYLWPA